jgi:murein DD-endopeptidase MepM/ murein hydrolase activator NlpD
MENASLVIGAGACLSDYVIPSRDVNPYGSNLPANVYAPIGGEVWLVDSDYSGDNNSGYGKLVVLRIEVENLPAEVRTRVEARTGQTGGYVYIAYAHLSTINESVTAGRPIPESLLMGVSGSTGSDNVHLDISVIWDDDAGLTANRFYGSDDWQSWNTLATNLSQVNAVKLDPLDIWPELGPEPSCCATSTCE